jgi:nitrate/nitrite-specific signal transduction histidine kinase
MGWINYSRSNRFARENPDFFRYIPVSALEHSDYYDSEPAKMYNSDMDSSQLNLGIFALVGVIMLVLSGASFSYLVWVKNKSRSSWMLLWFFLCVIFSSIATILTNTGLVWAWAFAPTQDALLILGSVFLVQFAYLYPADDQPGEARLVTVIFSILALGTAGYALSFAIRFLSSLPIQIDENQAFYLITPVVIVFLMFIFFRRSQHCSAQIIDPDQETRAGAAAIRAFSKPENQSALGLRNFGLALAAALIPAVVTISKFALPALFASYLFNFGVIVAIAAMMLVYLNHAPEPTIITAKLVGISLVTVLLILGLASVWIILNIPGEQVHATVLAFIFLVLLSSLLIIFLFPLFFNSTLLRPLNRLLQGVRAADDGNLDIQVEVQYEDEIGLITQSFNRLISSLKVATQELKNESALLERQIGERTAELCETNEQLISENLQRKEAQARLDRQLRYEQALSGCSQSLLMIADDEESQLQTLTQALEQLRAGAQASRAYVFRNIPDPELGPCMGILAEACASEILPHMDNPANQKFPWSQLPREMFTALQANEPYGGPVAQAFASTPELMEAFLRQYDPLLSIECLPIFCNNQWWGFIGFDDCKNARPWDEQEILMLRTASELVGNTVQRWQAEERLHQTLGHLEERVRERTLEFAQANADLRYEIHERQILQKELEERLEIEMILARISARLLSPNELQIAIQETMADLGQMLQAKRVAFVQFDSSSNDGIGELIEWRHEELDPLPKDRVGQIMSIYPGFYKQLKANQTIYIDDPATLPEEYEVERSLLIEREISSLLLVPLFIDDQLAGYISCRNPEIPKPKVLANIRIVEVVGGMLASLLRREGTLNLLEEKVAERTRELSAFFDMAMLAGETRQLADTMQPALVKVMEIMACEAGAIHLFDEDQQTLSLIAQQGIPKAYFGHIESIPVDLSLRTWINSQGDREGYPGHPSVPAVFKFPAFHSVYHSSLRAKGNVQGLLSCFRLADAPFDSYQSYFLNAISEQLGMAVENYHLRLKVEKVATMQERQRLARELHDAVSQSLYSLTLYARSGQDAVVAGDHAKLMDSLQQLETNSLGALKEMRLLLYQLRSLALEEKGLLQAIEARFNLVERRSGIQASITMDESIKLLDNVEQELFLLITEALNNALKHARASQVSVSIQKENKHIVLEVQDNGSGFDPSLVIGGMGMTNMHERAAALGGQIKISNQTEHGTRIHLEIPRPQTWESEG